MGIDFVGKFNNLKSAYQRERGASTPAGIKSVISGLPLIPPSKGVPRTTWGDALLVFNHLHKIAEPTYAECMDAHGDAQACNAATLFMRTPAFVRAKLEFDKQNPYLRGAALAGSPGNVIVGAQYLASRLAQPYPWNEELWGYGSQYALTRSAAGDVPFWVELQVSAVKEAIQEAPAAVKAILENAWEAIPNPVPLLNWTVEIIKWGSIAGGLFLLYKYVLKPTDSAPEKAE